MTEEKKAPERYEVRVDALGRLWTVRVDEHGRPMSGVFPKNTPFVRADVHSALVAQLAQVRDEKSALAMALAGIRSVTNGCASAECHVAHDTAERALAAAGYPAGSTWSGQRANALGRAFVGVELNPEFAEMARRRIDREGAPLFAGATS